VSLGVVVVLMATAGSAHAAGKPKRIVGGNIVTSTEEAPWSVLLTAAGAQGTTICSGSIIAPTRVLTAAHCALEGGRPRVPGAFMLLAGIVDSELGADWTRMQARAVGAVSVHPYYVPGQRGYDVAVLELAQPFDVSGASVRPVALAAASATGPLRVYGWGNSTQTSLDGQLHSLTQTGLRPFYCVSGAPAMLCGQAPTGATCFGDSGSGLIAPGRGLVGVGSIIIADTDGSADCDAGESTGYIDVTAPAIALWLAGNPAPPRAPRTTARATLAAGDPLTCQAPAFSDAPQVSYDFFSTAGELLQSGPPTYRPSGPSLGRPITCVAVARNAGGTAEALAAAPVTMLDPGLGLQLGQKGELDVSRSNPAAPVSRLVIYDRAGTVVRTAPLDVSKPMSVPRLPAGRYSVCVQSDATTTFVAASACQAWTVAGKAANLLATASIKRWHGRWRVALRASPGLVGKRVTLRWRIGTGRHVSIRRKLTATTRVNSPRVPRSTRVRLTAIAPATTADGVPYAASHKVFKIRPRDARARRAGS
jgi:hypothetical protein